MIILNIVHTTTHAEEEKQIENHEEMNIVHAYSLIKGTVQSAERERERDRTLLSQ